MGGCYVVLFFMFFFSPGKDCRKAFTNAIAFQGVVAVMSRRGIHWPNLRLAGGKKEPDAISEGFGVFFRRFRMFTK